MAYFHKNQLYEKQLTNASLSGQNIYFLKMLKHYLFSNHSKTVTVEFQRAQLLSAGYVALTLLSTTQVIVC
jgi:hypothetical protein